MSDPLSKVNSQNIIMNKPETIQTTSKTNTMDSHLAKIFDVPVSDIDKHLEKIYGDRAQRLKSLFARRPELRLQYH